MISPAKQALIAASNQLPENCSWDDVMYTLYVRQKIQQGLSEADQGEFIDHAEVFEEFADVPRPAGVDESRPK